MKVRRERLQVFPNLSFVPVNLLKENRRCILGDALEEGNFATAHFGAPANESTGIPREDLRARGSEGGYQGVKDSTDRHSCRIGD